MRRVIPAKEPSSALYGRTRTPSQPAPLCRMMRLRSRAGEGAPVPHAGGSGKGSFAPSGARVATPPAAASASVDSADAGPAAPDGASTDPAARWGSLDIV